MQNAGPLQKISTTIDSGVLFFQVMLRQKLHWSVTGLAFVLLASRLREESSGGMRSGVIRTVRSTGGVITAAGLIFAASMFGLLLSSIGVVVQGGFVIGVGILVDTFLVRSITVPAIAALLGRASWWPSRPWEHRAADDVEEREDRVRRGRSLLVVQLPDGEVQAQGERAPGEVGQQ